MDKLKLHTPDLTAANIEKLAALFPDCVTETRDEKGRSRGRLISTNSGRNYPSTSWKGLANGITSTGPASARPCSPPTLPIAKTLRPCREESVDFDTTKNLFIEGDNLDALKLLQETYLGKVKMIYIDPPYNTGSDLIYDDVFEDFFFLRRKRQPTSVNAEGNGRFHSDWITMMFPRLKLARNLLRDDGVIFISIDDREQAALKLVCDQVFGIDNFSRLRLPRFKKSEQPRGTSGRQISTTSLHIQKIASRARHFSVE